MTGQFNVSRREDGTYSVAPEGYAGLRRLLGLCPSSLRRVMETDFCAEPGRDAPMFRNLFHAVAAKRWLEGAFTVRSLTRQFERAV